MKHRECERERVSERERVRESEKETNKFFKKERRAGKKNFAS